VFGTSDNSIMHWESISTAPFPSFCDTAGQVYALVFLTRRILGGWINAETKQRIEDSPTQWREWREMP
jgi:hypothetical protein